MIQFPINPILNQEYSYESKTWIWDGISWNLKPFQETDTIFNASQAKNITSTHISVLNNTSGTNTGDQDLTGLVEKINDHSLVPDTEINKLSEYPEFEYLGFSHEKLTDKNSEAYFQHLTAEQVDLVDNSLQEVTVDENTMVGNGTTGSPTGVKAGVFMLISDVASKVFNTFNTTSKTIEGAINELILYQESTAIKISTPAELFNVSNFPTYDFELSNDIDMAGVEFNGLCSSVTPYTGTFDGKGHIIKGLSYNNSSTNYMGLFVATDGATIKNLGIESANIVGSSDIGGVVGVMKGGTVQECYVANSYIEGRDHVGSIGGQIKGGAVIQNCYANANVYSREFQAGGLVGVINDNNTKIFKCYFSGIVRCNGNRPSGIAAWRDNGTPIVSNCVNLASYILGPDNLRVVGNESITISNLYSISSCKLSSNYNNFDSAATIPTNDTNYGTNKRHGANIPGGDANALSANFYETTLGWDFTVVWRIDKGVEYPKLSVFNTGLAKKPQVVVNYTHTGNKEVNIESIDFATGTITATGHGLAVNSAVYPINKGMGNFLFSALPNGINPLTGYFVINVTTNTFQLSLTLGGTPITLSDKATKDYSKWHLERPGLAIISGLSLRKFTVEFEGKSSGSLSAGDYFYLIGGKDYGAAGNVWITDTEYSKIASGLNRSIFKSMANGDIWSYNKLEIDVTGKRASILINGYRIYSLTETTSGIIRHNNEVAVHSSMGEDVVTSFTQQNVFNGMNIKVTKIL